MATRRLRLALDQNFPADLLRQLTDYIPTDVELIHIAQVDPRLSRLSDRHLFFALRQLGLDGLVTNNYKMLDLAHEVAAIIATKAVVFATEGLGHDPIRAAGALLLELPGLPNRLKPGRENIILFRHTPRAHGDGWEYLTKIAQRQSTTAPDLWSVHKPSDEEMGTPYIEFPEVG